MEKVWLSTTYYLDERMAELTPAEEVLFTRLLAFCGASESGGFMPARCWLHVGLVRGKSSFTRLVQRGVIEELPDGRSRFPAWTAWQKQGDELVKRRKSDRDRKRKERALSAAKSRDMSRDVRPLEEKRGEEEPTYVGSAAYESNASASTREPHPGGPAVPVDGWRLVRAAIPDEHPQATRTALALEAGTLLAAGSPPGDVDAALRLWLTKPNLGPRTLPSLVSEVLKGRTAPAAGRASYRGSEAIDAGAEAARILAASQTATNAKELE